MFHEVFQPFIEQSAVSIMFRGTLENVFRAERLDHIFETTAVRQRTGPLLFSTCADLLSVVVLSARKSVNSVYKSRRHDLQVSAKAVYDKLAGVEPAVSERLVRDTAADLAQVVDELGAVEKGPLPGFDTRILDGNHLAGTDHRLAELRRLGAAALPGESLVILDPQRKLLLDVVTCEDGHANERTLIPAVLARVQRRQCWIGDSSFCTLDFLFGIRQREAYCLVRQHGALKGELQGKRKKIGRCRTGVVYEQPLLVRRKDGTTTVRRISIMRDKPTAKSEKEVHLLTNLPDKVSAVKAAEAYLDRWLIETAFQDLATTLRSEINTLGYPKAALFGFCLALVMFNVLSAVKAALRMGAKGAKPPGAKGEGKESKLSTYYLADEVSGVWRGMEIAIPEAHWEETFGTLTPKQLVAKLLWLARKVDLRQFYTNRWTPKRPQPKRISGNRGNHVSTHEILQQRVKQQKKERMAANR
ncbi:MAG: transposase [Burkholderiales bacterium]